MSDAFRFDQPEYLLPPGAMDADPASAMRGLYGRVAALEASLHETQAQATADMGDVLAGLLSLTDQVAEIVERWGVATSAQEIALVRSVVAIGKGLHAVLARHGVQAIDTLGKPQDPATSDVVGSETRADLRQGMVLREERPGYRWGRGILRRARVVISAPAAQSAPGTADPEGPENTASRSASADTPDGPTPDQRTA